MNFKQWLEMAEVSRQSIPLDQADIDYIKQFPPRKWRTALKMRYNDLLFQAVNSDGKIKSGWNDVQQINLPSSGRGDSRPYTIDTGMRAVVKKLKSLGYDLRGINDANKTIPYFTPMSSKTANQIMTRLKKTDPEYTGGERGKSYAPENMQPNVAFFSPNQNASRRDDIEPTDKSMSGIMGKHNYEVSKDEIEQQVQKIMERSFSGMESKKDSVLYPNVLWWSQPNRYKELWQKINRRILLNWKNPLVHTEEGRMKFIHNEIRKVVQNGVAGRRTLEKMRNIGHDVNSLFSKINPETNAKWTPIEVKQALARPSGTNSPNASSDYYHQRGRTVADLSPLPSADAHSQWSSDVLAAHKIIL
jgi:hypothetical protein